MDTHRRRLDPTASRSRRSITAKRLAAAVAKLTPAQRARAAGAAALSPIDSALRDAIRGSNLTHYALGKAAGVAPAQLDRFVSGERSLSLASAAKVAAALGLVLVPRR